MTSVEEASDPFNSKVPMIKVGDENKIIYRLWVLVTVIFLADGSIGNLYEIVLPSGSAGIGPRKADCKSSHGISLHLSEPCIFEGYP